MKILVVYYSLDGNTKYIAEAIAAETSADLLELKPKKEITGGRVSKLFWGGKQILFKEKPELEPLVKNIDDYDLIFFGTPVWVGTYTPPFKTLFDAHKIVSKKIGLFCTFAGNASRIFNDFKKVLEGNEFLGEIGFKEPLKHDKETDARLAKEWARGLVGSK